MSDESGTGVPPAPKKWTGPPPPAPPRKGSPRPPAETAPVEPDVAPARHVRPPDPVEVHRPARSVPADVEPDVEPVEPQFPPAPSTVAATTNDPDELDEPDASTGDDDIVEDERFVVQRPTNRIASNVQGTLIISGAKAGGVGKSSTAAHVAEMAALEGLRTICLDEKSQGDLRKRLGFDDSKTLWQIARYWDGTPDGLAEWIVTTDATKTDWIVGPDSAPEDYDDDLIPDEMLGRLVDVLLDQYEVVVVDTHPAKKQSTSIFYTEWIPRLVRNPRHAVIVVSEWDRAKLNSAVDWVTSLVAAGVDPARTFFLGQLPQSGATGALAFENVARRFTMARTLQPIPFSQAVKDANNGLGDSPMGGWRDPVYKAAIRACLRDVLGDDRFEPEEVPSGWRSLFKRGR